MPASRRMPPLRALEAFVRIVRLGSAKAAANELGLSPSALSRRVGALEDFVGKRLFTRQHQAMRLTDDGQAFYNAVSPRLEELAAAVESQMEAGNVMRLHLGVPALFAVARLMPRLPELRKLHPRLHIDLDTGSQLDSELGDSIDAAIILAKEPDPALHAVRLSDNQVHAFATRELAAELGEQPDIARLSKQTFFVSTTPPDSFDVWKAGMGLEKLEPASVDHYDAGPLLMMAAVQGLGIAIMHDDHFLRGSSVSENLVRLFGKAVDSPYSYWFVCRPRALEARPVRLFYDWLVKAAI